MTNLGVATSRVRVSLEIESGYKSIKRFMAATTSKNFWTAILFTSRSHAYLYSIWRAVDLLVQVELTGEYEHSPIVADNTPDAVEENQNRITKTHPW